MSEYWVSKKRYHCKYCNIFIADDVPSKQHHENGMRHKGNVERFVRGLYKAGEKAVKDKEEEKREMERIGRAAAEAYAQDVGAGRGGVGLSSTPAAAPAPKKPSLKPSNPYANYSTAASLGYADPDAERAKAEADMRQTMGIAGEWQFVPSSSISPAPIRSEVPSAAGGTTGETIGSSEGGGKREAPVDDAEDERTFKLRKKTADIGLGELYDPDLIPIKLKVKKEESVDPQPASSSSKVVVQNMKADVQDALSTDAPKMKIQWKRAAFQPAVEESAPNGVTADFGGESAPEIIAKEHVDVKEEVMTARAEPEPPIPPEFVKQEDEISPSLDAPPAPTGLFRKRKLPTRR